MNSFILDDEGNLTAQAIFARAGIQYYLLNGTKTPVLREPSEIKDAASSFDNLPVTLEHPEEGVIDKNNEKELKKGISEESKFNQGLIYGKLKISDKELIEKAKTTHPQISCGYKCELIKENGTWKDEYGIHGHVGEVYSYEYKQKNIKGNHVALVQKGRAGALASIQIDDNEKEQNLYFIEDIQEQENVNQTKKRNIDKNGAKMSKEQIIFEDRVLELEGNDAGAISNEISKLKENIKNLHDSLQEKNNEISELKKTIENYEDKTKKLESDLNDSFSQKNIKERLEIWNEVSDYLDSNEIDYGKNPTEIKKLYLNKFHPEYNLEDASEEYINGLWVVLQPKNQIQDNKSNPSEALNSTKTQPKINRNRN